MLQPNSITCNSKASNVLSLNILLDNLVFLKKIREKRERVEFFLLCLLFLKGNWSVPKHFIRFFLVTQLTYVYSSLLVHSEVQTSINILTTRLSGGYCCCPVPFFPAHLYTVFNYTFHPVSINPILFHF